MSKVVSTAHGTGGRSQHELIEQIFKPVFINPLLSSDDAAEFHTENPDMLITTDMHVVDPIEFPGGDIGKLSICGVINDLLTRGGKPEYISLGFILEEGLPIVKLKKIVLSAANELKAHDIKLLCADTKVIPARSDNPGLMIGSTLLGTKISKTLKLKGPQIGDSIILTNSIGSHGLAILQAREKLSFKNTFHSDCKSLFGLLAPILIETTAINYMRDPTRGGVASVLHELAVQFDLSFEINEQDLPVDADVKVGLNLLGIDPLEVANEGVMLLFVNKIEAESLLKKIKNHSAGSQAAIIGEVTQSNAARLILITNVGGKRRIPWPEALNLPRIC